MSRSSQEEDVDPPTFAVEDDVLPGWAEVCVDVQAVSFIQLTCQTASREQSHRFHTEETRLGSPLHPQQEILPPPPMHVSKRASKAREVRSCPPPSLLTSVDGDETAEFSSASDGLAAEMRADNDNYTTQETRIAPRKLHDEVATQPNANFNLLTLLLDLWCGEQT